MRIFISYRRDDSKDTTGHIYDRLRGSFGKENLFFDVCNIPAGVDWHDHIQNHVHLSDIVVAMIGKDWLKLLHERSQNPDKVDYVRFEIETAISLNKRVMPVIVNGARKPSIEELSFNPLIAEYFSRQQEFQINFFPYFDNDVDRFTRQLKGYQVSGVNEPIDKIMPRPFEWCEVPQGTILYNSEIQEVSKFYIAKYPITNAQFQVFIDDENGYSNPNWWKFSRNADLWKAQYGGALPSRFQFLRVQSDNRPRETVNWYEAKAFCLWLSYKTGLNITLPTIEQRLRAGQGDDGRLYPWGNKFSTSRCNSREVRPKQTTWVDRFPDGASPYDVCDLSGNVWEWGLSDKYTETQEQILCGGGWRSRRQHTKLTSMRKQLVNYRADDVGFRICTSTNISS